MTQPDYRFDDNAAPWWDAPVPEADRTPWMEPDPVDVFAAKQQQAMHELRVEVAGLRAERDGLRLEAEGLRAKLELLQAQRFSRDAMADTVRQLQSVVNQLVVDRAGATPVLHPQAPREIVPEVRVAEIEPAEVVAPAAVVIEDEPTVAPAAPTRRRRPAHAATRSDRGRRALRVLTGAAGAVAVVILLAVAVGPKVLPYQTYFVRSGSMAPTFDTGSLVVLTKVDAEELVEGDIITFDNPDQPGMLVTHRVFAVENGPAGRQLVTKGDANADPDPWRVPARGSGYRYAFDVPMIGYVFGYLSTPLARVALIVIPAGLLGLLSLLERRRAPRDER